MTKERNIQSLFLAIRLDQIRRYLIAGGWTEKETSIRREFELSDENSNDTRQLILPLEESHPRFRSLVPNVVFSLAVASEREAIDIAEEIAQIELPDSLPKIITPQQLLPSNPISEPCRIEFCNSGSSAISLKLSPSGSKLEILPSESLLLSIKIDEGILQIRADGNLECELPTCCESQVFWGFPAHQFSLESAEALADQIYGSSSHWEVGSSTNISVLRRTLVSAANRFLFEIEIPSKKVGAISNTNLKSLAVLLVAVSQLMKACHESPVDLFGVARSLCKPFGLTFLYSDELPFQLWVTLRSDKPEAPRNSVAFLKSMVHA